MYHLLIELINKNMDDSIDFGLEFISTWPKTLRGRDREPCFKSPRSETKAIYSLWVYASTFEPWGLQEQSLFCKWLNPEGSNHSLWARDGVKKTLLWFGARKGTLPPPSQYLSKCFFSDPKKNRAFILSMKILNCFTVHLSELHHCLFFLMRVSQFFKNSSPLQSFLTLKSIYSYQSRWMQLHFLQFG